jgi:hypothetical protein
MSSMQSKTGHITKNFDKDFKASVDVELEAIIYSMIVCGLRAFVAMSHSNKAKKVLIVGVAGLSHAIGLAQSEPRIA